MAALDILGGENGGKNMMPVKQQDEPPNFNRDVRMPGLRFLQDNPAPKKIGRHNYWRRISPELYRLYGGICAYTGMWFPDDASSDDKRSVDHFLPKSKYPDLAYEWSNYRLTTQNMNSVKGDETGLVDPFEVKHDWFLLDFYSSQIQPNPSLPDDIRGMIDFTILTLKLNIDEERVNKRFEIIQDYLNKKFDLDSLQRRFPYIAYEIQRQGLKQNDI